MQIAQLTMKFYYTGPLAALTVKKVKERGLKLIVGVATLILGALTLGKLIFSSQARLLWKNLLFFEKILKLMYIMYSRIMNKNVIACRPKSD